MNAGITGFVAAGLCAIFAVDALAEECVVEGDTVELVGKVWRETFPGPPNYESIERGDRPETVWILTLDQPLCLHGISFETNEIYEVRNVRRIQLALTEEQYKLHKSRVFNRVHAEGRVFSAHSGHHHTKALITVTDLRPVEKEARGQADTNQRIQYCGEMRREGESRLCVERNPVNTYLVVWLTPADNGWPKIHVRISRLSLTECLNLPARARCYRMGVYTLSQERLVREMGEKPRFHGLNSPTYREYYEDYKPRANDAQTATIEMQMSTVPGFLMTHTELSQCHVTEKDMEEVGSEGNHLFKDCAFLWLEPMGRPR